MSILTELIIPREMDGPERFGHEENKSGPDILQNYAEIFAASRRAGNCTLHTNHFDLH
jgi:hypothetical protein